LSDQPTPPSGPPPFPVQEPSTQDEPPPPAPPTAAEIQVAQLQATAPPPGQPAPAKRKGRRRSIVILAVLVVFIGVVLYVARNNVQANDLKVGDCFNVPTDATFQTVEKHPCNESHTGEVIFVGEYSGATYPISPDMDSYVSDQCVPAYEAYVGRAYDSEPQLDIGYMQPTQDGWNSGDRTVTCYITQPDDSPMTESVKGS
jgi:hypothetical protein